MVGNSERHAGRQERYTMSRPPEIEAPRLVALTCIENVVELLTSNGVKSERDPDGNLLALVSRKK
jgi:hypothetical protein